MAFALVASERAPWPAGEVVDARVFFGLVIPVASGWALTERVHWLGFGRGIWRRGGAVLALGLPLAFGAVALLAREDSVQQHYAAHAGSLSTLASRYAISVLQVEACFRGALLFGLLPRLGPALAAAATVIPYGLVHLDKPLAEALGSIPVGLALACAALWTRSIWYGAIVHLAASVALTLFVAR
jgi:membrane protease YdiL (CAAX protease family)